jgi:hypothetical protein
VAPQKPTHKVKHIDGWEANIYIAPSLQQQLKSRDEDKRNNARTSVCIRFNRACEKKFPKWNTSRRVEWDQIELTEIVPLPPTVKSRAIPTPVRVQECDDCAWCDIGNHHQCRNCTLWG